MPLRRRRQKITVSAWAEARREEQRKINSRILALHDQVVAQRQQAAAERAALVASLTARYYALAAEAETDFAAGASQQRASKVGQMTGLRDALAEITGIHPTLVSFRLDHSIPVTGHPTTAGASAPTAAPLTPPAHLAGLSSSAVTLAAG